MGSSGSGSPFSPSGLLARLRSLWRGLTRRDDLEAEVHEEFRHHIEARTEDLMRREGLTRAEARRRAHREFGHADTHRAGVRASRGLHVLDGIGFSLLDFKLGVRMLVKHPVLTVVTGFALAVGIPMAVAPIHFLGAVQEAPPVPDGDRIHLLRYVEPGTGDVEAPPVGDFVLWREELAAFETIGLVRESPSNVVFGDGGTALVRGAEVTASAFEILRVPPLIGRTLIPSDEAFGAAPVVVVGHDLWESDLDGDRDLGSLTLRIAGETYDVVGVMPEGFRFPFQAQLWLPVRAEVLAGADGSGGSYSTFGRLAGGVTLEQAEAELATVLRRAGTDASETEAGLRPYVMPIAAAWAGLPKDGLGSSLDLWLFPLFTVLVLGVACTNVAMLMLARTANRLEELTVRTALGASRLRIVTQLFTESLILAVLATGAGLFVADRVLARFLLSTPTDPVGGLPYWIDLRIAPATVLWALGLAVLSAAVVGVLPALKATGRAVRRNIQEAGSRRSGLRFGRLTSALLVVDVAAAVALVGLVSGVSISNPLGGAGADLGIPDEEMLAATLTISRIGAPDPSDAAEFEARLAETQRELVRRLEAQPGVRGVAVGSDLPHELHSDRWIEVEGVSRPAGSGEHLVEIARVDPDFFQALGQPILAGRGFDRSDLGEDRSAVVVNTIFVDQVLGGRSAIGRRVRYVTRGEEEPGPWYEIVGVVGDLGMSDVKPLDQGMYHPAAPGEIHPLRLAVHVGGDPASFTPRLRALVSEIDPAAMISDPKALDEVQHAEAQFRAWFGLLWGTVAAVLLGLAASGIYALMSLSVAERTREIGIRIALGAQRRSVAFTIVRRALVQLGAGVLVGTLVTGALWYTLAQYGDVAAWDPLGSSAAALVLGVSVLCLVGAIACTSPLMRALSVTPTDALRVE